MLQAQLEDGGLVLLALYRPEQIRELRKQRFLCPACKKPVIIRAGKKVVPHFAHDKVDACDLHHGGESLYHMQGKLQLFHWFKKQGYSVKLEERVEKIDRRPDLLVYTKSGRMLAIEYQCAAISDEELLSRNEAYAHNGITPIWILGGNRMKRTSTYMFDLPKREQRFLMRYKQDMPLQLLYYCADNESFCNVQHILLTGKKQTIGQFYFRNLHQLHFPDLFKTLPINLQQIMQTWQDFQTRIVAKPLTHAPSIVKRWVMNLYNKGLLLQDIPANILQPVDTQYRLSVPPYIWQTDLWLEQLHHLPLKEEVSLERLISITGRWEITSKPFAISVETHPAESYMKRLCRAGWFEPVGSDMFKKKRKSPFEGAV
ncbi:competence protein CoiA family protein [Terribacillus saccharophilus]|uniref:competence protein CoiA n=1 Tax=Terribacillus saccharophilus TaxID=361277 RepID=UPI003981D367